MSKKLHKKILSKFEEYYPVAESNLEFQHDLLEAFKELGTNDLSEEQVIEDILSFLKKLKNYNYRLRD